MVRDRFVSLHLRFALNSFGRDLERPGKHQRNRESNNNDEDDNLHHPLRRIESRKKNRRSLNEEPRHNRVGDGYFVNVAPLQLGKEVVDLHFDVPSQSFWKRGSLRSGSHSGSSLRLALVRPAGTCRRWGNAAIAVSLSPKRAWTCASVYSACGLEVSSSA